MDRRAYTRDLIREGRTWVNMSTPDVMAGAHAFVFPGQGSQYVGMGADLAGSSAAAGTIFERADNALGFALSRLMFEGPASPRLFRVGR